MNNLPWLDISKDAIQCEICFWLFFRPLEYYVVLIQQSSYNDIKFLNTNKFSQHHRPHVIKYIAISNDYIISDIVKLIGLLSFPFMKFDDSTWRDEYHSNSMLYRTGYIKVWGMCILKKKDQ